MQKKLIIGLILFGAGILLDIASDVAGIWIIGVLAGILWPIGMVMGTNALLNLKKIKQSNDSPSKSTENENN